MAAEQDEEKAVSPELRFEPGEPFLGEQPAKSPVRDNVPPKPPANMIQKHIGGQYTEIQGQERGNGPDDIVGDQEPAQDEGRVSGRENPSARSRRKKSASRGSASRRGVSYSSCKMTAGRVATVLTGCGQIQHQEHADGQQGEREQDRQEPGGREGILFDLALDGRYRKKARTPMRAPRPTIMIRGPQKALRPAERRSSQIKGELPDEKGEPLDTNPNAMIAMLVRTRQEGAFVREVHPAVPFFACPCCTVLLTVVPCAVSSALDQLHDPAPDHLDREGARIREATLAKARER